MTTKNPHDSGVPPGDANVEHAHGERFVERMLSGLAHPGQLPASHLARPVEPLAFRPLRETKAERGARYRLQTHNPRAVRAQADSPAIEVMTDLAHVPAVSVRPYATVEEAHHAMHAHRVRALFVVDEHSAVLGLVTSTDLLGEKPVQIAHQRGVRHQEVLVHEVMTPADRLEAMGIEDVVHARVGDVIATLKRSGRRHALVVESPRDEAGPPTHTVRGIFSITQIARLLGLPPEPGHDVARTFAEIEAAIGA